MQLHGKTIVWLQWGVEYNAEEIMFRLDRSKSSCVDRLWMSELNSEKEHCVSRWIANHVAKIGNYQYCSGFHFGEPYSQ